MKRLVALTAALVALVAATAADARPGDLVSATPMTALVAPGVPMPGQAWKITYRSTTAEGAPTVVTGTVLVPPGGSDPQRPLIGYAIGTQGLADRCAPSAQLAAGTEYEATLIEDLVQRGWTLALTDYPGLGTPGDHTYVVGRANGPAVLDAMRAARGLPQAGVGPDAPLALFGYSEGGGAVGAAVERQPTYAPDLPLKGAAVGGVVANFERSREFLEGSAVSFLLAYTAIGFNAAYPELHLDDSLNDRGRAYVAQMRDSCIFDAVGTQPFAHATDFTTTDVLSSPAWKRRLRENDLGDVVPRTPVLLQHARNDEALPFAAAETLAQKWCALGGDVDFRPLLGPEHILGGFENVGPATDWLAQRFAGAPTTGCHPSAPGVPRLGLAIVRRTAGRIVVRGSATPGHPGHRPARRGPRPRGGRRPLEAPHAHPSCSPAPASRCGRAPLRDRHGPRRGTDASGAGTRPAPLASSAPWRSCPPRSRASPTPSVISSRTSRGSTG